MSTDKADQLAELLAGEAAGDLDLQEEAELRQLAGALGTGQRAQFLTVAGLVQLACLRRESGGLQRIPRSLETRLMRRAEDWSRPIDVGRGARRTAGVAGGSRPRADRRYRPSRAWFGAAAAGWYVAAGLAMVMVVWRTADLVTPVAPTGGEARAALMRDAPDLITLSWAPTAEPGYGNVTGDVVWSSRLQQGYLRLSGMPVNDPRHSQYQLWVVDPERDSRPVDGGVFDVSSTGTVTIPVQAKLRIGHPQAFAITLEHAGGVVVSAGPLLVVASVTG